MPLGNPPLTTRAGIDLDDCPANPEVIVVGNPNPPSGLYTCGSPASDSFLTFWTLTRGPRKIAELPPSGVEPMIISTSSCPLSSFPRLLPAHRTGGVSIPAIRVPRFTSFVLLVFILNQNLYDPITFRCKHYGDTATSAIRLELALNAVYVTQARIKCRIRHLTRPSLSPTWF